MSEPRKVSINLNNEKRIERLEQQLSESKQREAKWKAQIKHWRDAAWDRQQERDVAMIALEITRTALKTIRKRWHFGDHSYLPALVIGLLEPAEQALNKIADPSAALAERDRAITRELRLRIHNTERHNQYFERCESKWCNPIPTLAAGSYNELADVPQGDWYQCNQNWLDAHDLAIEKRTAERCADIANTYYPAGWVKARIDREFNLEPKPEGE